MSAKKSKTLESGTVRVLGWFMIDASTGEPKKPCFSISLSDSHQTVHTELSESDARKLAASIIAEMDRLANA